MTTLPAAVLWDMDGTIIDTEPYWMAAETELVVSFGGTWSHAEALTLVGQALDYSARVLQSRGVDLPEDEIIETLTEIVSQRVLTEELPWRPGARELLYALREAGIPTALVTMSIRKLAEVVADAIDFEAFDHIVAGDDVTNGKPNPEAYLRAAELLGVDPTSCVAIEDSGPGVAAAVASGAATIAVPLHVELAGSDTFTTWSSLADRTIADLSDVLESSTSRTVTP